MTFPRHLMGLYTLACYEEPRKVNLTNQTTKYFGPCNVK
jgi:hypothetical protein